MQVFELHFNPKLKEEQIFDSFIYEPENIYEKNLGSIYMVAELQNALPQNLKLLDELAKLIKRNYYTLSLKSPEKALSQTLKAANEFLADQVKKENVSWLGNLNFGLFSLKELELFFTKTGNLKILLIRKGEIIDIGRNLDIEEIEPYPLKVFFSVVSGKLTQNDIILVLTKEVFDFFKEQNLLTKIARAENLGSKEIKEILPASLFVRGPGSKISGICLLSLLKTKFKATKRPEEIFFQKEKRRLALPILKLPSFKLPKIKIPKIKIPKIKIPEPGFSLQQKTNFKKKLILILVLIIILFFGFLVFKREEKKKENNIKSSLSEIQEKIAQAENFLIFKNEKQANTLLKETWQEAVEAGADADNLKETIEEKLEELNKLEKIENPQAATDFAPSLFSSPNPPSQPQFEFNFDSSASYLSNLYFLDKETCKIIKYPYLEESNWSEPKIWKEMDENCSHPKSMAIDGSIWILNEDNSILRYHKGIYQETIFLDIFPFVENISKIETNPETPYLYLLEPVKNRLIVIDKKGGIFQQFQSEKFDKLSDLSLSENGKTIYLLNDSLIYKLEI